VSLIVIKLVGWMDQQVTGLKLLERCAPFLESTYAMRLSNLTKIRNDEKSKMSMDGRDRELKCLRSGVSTSRCSPGSRQQIAGRRIEARLRSSMIGQSERDARGHNSSVSQAMTPAVIIYQGIYFVDI